MTPVQKDGNEVKAQFQLDGQSSYIGTFRLSGDGQLSTDEIEFELPDGGVGSFALSPAQLELVDLPLTVSVFNFLDASGNALTLAAQSLQFALACTSNACAALPKPQDKSVPGAGQAGNCMGPSGDCDRLFFTVVDRPIAVPLIGGLAEFVKGEEARHRGAVLVCAKGGSIFTEAVGGISAGTDETDRGIVQGAFENGVGTMSAGYKLIKQREINPECCGWFRQRLKEQVDSYNRAVSNGAIGYTYFAHESSNTEVCSLHCIGGVCPAPSPSTESEFRNGVQQQKLYFNCRTQVNDYAAIADSAANAPECNLGEPESPPECGYMTWECIPDSVNSSLNPPMWHSSEGCTNILTEEPERCAGISMENSPCSRIYDQGTGAWKDAFYRLGEKVLINCVPN